jgi:hypothetical protein
VKPGAAHDDWMKIQRKGSRTVRIPDARASPRWSSRKIARSDKVAMGQIDDEFLVPHIMLN